LRGQPAAVQRLSRGPLGDRSHPRSHPHAHLVHPQGPRRRQNRGQGGHEGRPDHGGVMARVRTAVAAGVPLVVGGWPAAAAPADAASAPLTSVIIDQPTQNTVESQTETPVVSGTVHPADPAATITTVQVTATPSNHPAIVFPITPTKGSGGQWSFS